jgi:hypothetical protein
MLYPLSYGGGAGIIGRLSLPHSQEAPLRGHAMTRGAVD